MNSYVCFWNGIRREVKADTSYDAQEAAVSVFKTVAGRKTVKRRDIVAVLAEKDGEEVIHIPID